MPILPRFSEPNTYVRYFGPNVLDVNDSTEKIRFLLLRERALPLKYPFRFGTAQGAPIGVGASTAQFSFKDLDPRPGNVYEAYLGVCPGVRLQIFDPADTRQLKWDEKITEIVEDYTAVVEYDDSPLEAPEFKLWIPQGKRFPGLVAQNKTDSLYQGGSSIFPEIIWIAAKWKTENADERNTTPAAWQQLNSDPRLSQPVRFGGKFPG